MMPPTNSQNRSTEPSLSETGPDVDGGDQPATGIHGSVTPPRGRDESAPAVGSRLVFLLQFFGSVAVVGAALIFLIFFHGEDKEPTDLGAAGPTALPRAVELAGPNLIRVVPSSSLGQKLVSGVVRLDRLTTAQLRVTGAVAASLRPIGPDSTDQWQFNDPEALAAFYEWRRAMVDVQFAEEQTRRMSRLNEIRQDSQRRIVERLRRLVDAGTDTEADLQLAEAELLQTDIEGRQAIHEAESDLRRARQEVAVSSRHLQLMGLDVDLLEQASSDVDVIVADVPEDYLSRVALGQQCEARFHGFPEEVFPGVVQRISPTLSLERRALRVLFFVDDPDDKLRPGMFANIGLGTEPRDATMVPAAAVIHVGKHDFVFARAAEESERDAQLWRLVSVEVGDTRSDMLEVLAGIEPGTEIIATGAILLKPLAASIVREATGGDR